MTSRSTQKKVIANNIKHQIVKQQQHSTQQKGRHDTISNIDKNYRLNI